MSGSEKRVTVPPAWATFILGAALAYALSVVNSMGNQNNKNSFPFIMCMVLLFIIVIYSCVHYTFTDKYLIVRLLWIPIRYIRWSEVSHAIYVHTWRENGNFRHRYSPAVMKGHGIIVSLGYCPPFNPQYTIRSSFSMAHPFSSLFISLPARSKEQCLSVFQHFYPDLVIQPDDFQITL